MRRRQHGPRENEEPRAKLFDLGSEPTTITSEMIRKGEELYREMGCVRCHGEQGYDDGASVRTYSPVKLRKELWYP